MRTSISSLHHTTRETFHCFNDRRLRIFILTASLCILMSALCNNVRAQSADTASTISADEAIDPCSNRVFWMSTGAVSAPGRVSIGLMGAPYLVVAGIYQATVVQLGYAPTDFLQGNLSGSASYWSAGVKARLLPPAGLFHGLALGVDFGFFPGTGGVIRGDNQVQSYNVAASIGTDHAECHLNVVQLVQSEDRRPTVFPTFVQVGMIISLPGGKAGHVSLMAELWMVNEYFERGLKTGAFILGVRHAGQTFVMELGFLGGPRILGSSGSENVRIFPIPYLGLMWFI